MEFIEELNILAKNSLELKDEIQTKEAVKHSLVMPFLALLGYNIFNPKEVVPEYTSDPYRVFLPIPAKSTIELPKVYL